MSGLHERDLDEGVHEASPPPAGKARPGRGVDARSPPDARLTSGTATVVRGECCEADCDDAGQPGTRNGDTERGLVRDRDQRTTERRAEDGPDAAERVHDR